MGQDYYRNMQIFLGILLIFTSISMVYRVTKRLARAHTLTSVNAVKNIDIYNPSSENNFKLVHCFGMLSTNTEIQDELFGPKANDCAKIVRIVEVCQWIEHKTFETDSVGRTIVHYEYEKEFCPQKIDQSKFNENLLGQ